MVTEHDEEEVPSANAATLHVAGTMTPAPVTKLTDVPTGTGLPCRSAIENVTFVVVPSTFSPSMLNFSSDKLAALWTGTPEATVNIFDDADTTVLDANVATTCTEVGIVPEKTGTDTFPVLSVVLVTGADEPTVSIDTPVLVLLSDRVIP